MSEPAPYATTVATVPVVQPGEQIVITMPLPSRELSPNARIHWAKKARAVKKHRADALVAAVANGQRPKWKQARAATIFYVKDKRRRDADNALASCKPIFDGIVDAGVLADDAGLSHAPIVFVVDKKNPRVTITISPL